MSWRKGWGTEGILNKCYHRTPFSCLSLSPPFSSRQILMKPKGNLHDTRRIGTNLILQFQRRRGRERELRPAAFGNLAALAHENISTKEWDISCLIVIEKDLAIPVAFQRYLVAQTREKQELRLRRQRGSGHFVQTSHAKEIATWIFGSTASSYEKSKIIVKQVF